MHPALWQLLWFDLRSSLRGLLAMRRNWRRVGLLIFMFVFVGFLFVSQAISGVTGTGAGGRFGNAMPFWVALYLMGTWLTAAADRGLVMRPAEIHFIVAGPFPTKDVITLNLIRLAYRASISALVLALVSMGLTQSFLGSFFGLWLLIGVSLLVGMIVALASRKVQSVWVHRGRRVLTVSCVAALVILTMQSIQLLRSRGISITMPNIAAAALDTQLGKIILPPLAWMFAPLTAIDFWPQVLFMAPSRLLIVALFVAMIYLLGADYREASTVRTDLSVARRQSALRVGSAGPSRWTRGISIPQFGYWFGIGPVAWMQVINSLRVLPRFLAFTVAVVAIVIVVPLTMEGGHFEDWGGVLWMAGVTGYADFLLLLQLPVGFLGPPSQRALLKSLPISSWAIVVGQLAGALAPLALVHLLVMLVFIYLSPANTLLMLQTAIALIPGALALTANINLLGAWNIIKPRALQQRDALAAGRAIISVWIFFAMLSPAIFAGVAGAFAVAALFGPAPSSYLVGAALSVLVCCGFYVALLARSFARWQPEPLASGEEVEH